MTVRSGPLQFAAVVAGTLVLALSSRIEIPMVPVPVTMQTLAVTMIGAAYGWRLGALTILAWLAEAAMGLPVLAGGGAGLAPFMGPTAGYLLAFPFAAALVGALVEAGWNGRRLGFAFLAMLLGNALCLAMGGAWLAMTTGMHKAILFGVTPFLLGGLLKSALGVALLGVFARKRRRKPDGVSMATFLLIPGGWQGGWAYQAVAETLAAHGHAAIPVTLAGLGDVPAPAANLDTHIAEVVTLVRTQPEPVVLVGHSCGGMIVSGVADAEPARVRASVYVDAYVPDTGDSVWSLTTQRFRDLFVAGAQSDGLTCEPAPGMDTRAARIRWARSCRRSH